MKITRLLFLLFIFLTFYSCTKEDAEQIECENQNIGYVDINNTSDDLYSVEIDGNFAFSLSGNTFNNDYELSAGSHVIVATQQTGFLLWPTVKTSNLSVQQCEHYSVVFP